MADKIPLETAAAIRELSHSIMRAVGSAERICAGIYSYLGYSLVGFPLVTRGRERKYDYWIAFKGDDLTLPTYKADTKSSLMWILEEEKRRQEWKAKEEAAGEAAVLRARVRAFAVEVRDAVKMLDGALTDLHNAALQMKDVSPADDSEMEEAWQAASTQVMAAAATVDALDKATRTRLRDVRCANQ